MDVDRSELEAVLEESRRRYIKMNIDTRDEDLGNAFAFWVNEISPNVAPYSHQSEFEAGRKSFYKELDQEKIPHISSWFG